jgi:outer membrane lipoprotein-sorting protein
MKQIIQILTITILVFATLPLYAITGEEALARFQQRMHGIGRMTGIISWTSHSGMTYTGTFKYMSPGKIYVKFSSPGGKVVVSNGKRLWVYDSGSNICGVQDLGRSGSGGIASMVNGYMAIVVSQGSGGYTLKLKNSERTYSEITLYLDGSFMLKRAVLKTPEGEGFSIVLRNVDTTAGVVSSMFNFNVPANSQVIKNPLNIR